jgi:pyruvate dehydrogenase E1 component alpha subunit
MVRMRAFDERVGDLFADGALPGFVHLYLGQEAVGTGAIAALEADDFIVSTHRGHGHGIAKGMDPERMLAELYGHAPGNCGGKGGSMHIADTGVGMLGANGIVGAGAPIAAGAALQAQYKDTGEVALAFFGEGAVGQGQVHEAINLAATWDLPAVFLIENNQYSEATPVWKEFNVEDLSVIATSYGIPGHTIDGMDVEAVYETVLEAATRARDGDGPTVIEAKTYRYHGHFEGDPEPYRTKDEVAEWRDRDPIDAFAARLRDAGELDDGERESMAEAARAEVAAADEAARDAPDPDPERAFADVFAVPAPEVEAFRERMDPERDPEVGR